MILSEKEMIRLAGTRQRPLLPMIRWPIQGMLEEVRHVHFPLLPFTPLAFFVDRGPLACICNPCRPAAAVYIHAILNRADAPRCVFGLICKHELIHTQIRSRRVDGRKTSHPPEFWDMERSIAPEREEAWQWIADTIWPWLYVRRGIEGYFVAKKWNAPMPRASKLSRPANFDMVVW